MQKIIKLSDTHYIGVDDSEIKLNDFITDGYNVWEWKDNCSLLGRKKVTHSTQPIEYYDHPAGGYEGMFDKIKELSLQEVEELTLGYSVEKMAEDYTEKWCGKRKVDVYIYDAFKAGFKEFAKDKLFTVEDMINAFVAGTNSGVNYESLVDYDSGNSEEAEDFAKSEFEEFKKSLLPKTEWEVTFDEQGKLKLV